MIVDLVHTVTSDGLRLDGALHQPSDVDIASGVVVCLPGVGSNFYASTILHDLREPLLASGLAVLWANTRGHDGLFTASTARGARRFGAAMESVDESRLDVAAWCDFAAEHGFHRVVLFGHSLGAIKALYSQAYERHPGVERIVAASPPCLSYSRFCQGERAALFLETIGDAERRRAEGREGDLMQVNFPFPLIISATGYLDKYGSQERYNILRFAHRVSVPVRFIYGGMELEHGGIAFAGIVEALDALPDHRQQFSFLTIPQADHMYSTHRAELAGAVADFAQCD